MCLNNCGKSKASSLLGSQKGLIQSRVHDGYTQYLFFNICPDDPLFFNWAVSGGGGVFLRLLTTAVPEGALSEIVWFPLSQGVAATVIKN